MTSLVVFWGASVCFHCGEGGFSRFSDHFVEFVNRAFFSSAYVKNESGPRVGAEGALVHACAQGNKGHERVHH